jgi:hypothetical protein
MRALPMHKFSWRRENIESNGIAQENSRLIMGHGGTCTYIGKDDLGVVYGSMTTIRYPCLL